MSFPIVKIGEVAEILSGFAFKSEFFNDSEGMQLIRIRDVVRGYSDTRYSGDFSDQYIVKNGEIVIGMDGNFNAARWNGGAALLNQRVCKITSKKDALDEDYLFHFLPSILKKIEDGTPFVTVKHLSASDLKNEFIPLPPLAEQRRVAAILDQADALRAKRREALVQLDSLTQSIFIEMFGDTETIYEKWPVKPLGELLEFLTSGSRGWAEYYSDNGALFLRIQNVRGDELDLSDVAFVSAPDSAEARRTEVKGGDVLLSITADLGRTAVIPEGIGKAHINQHLSILRTKAVAPRYLSAFIASQAGQREVMGRNKQGVKAGLNFDDIRSFRIPIPPNSLQLEFVRRGEQVKAQILTCQQSLTDLDALFASLQHRAFRGKL